jgi:PUA domain protein
MPNTTKRHFLKEKAAEKLLEELSNKLHVKTQQLLGSKPRIEVAENQSAKIFILNGKPILARVNHILSPTLIFEEILPLLPRIIVDMGAIPYVCNGADIMSPGIVRIQRDFDENDVLLVADEKYEKPLAIGIALYDSQRMRELKHGKVVRNIHYVGDRLWSLLKKIR